MRIARFLFVLARLGVLLAVMLTAVAAFGFRSLLYHPTKLTNAELDTIARTHGWQTARVEAEPGIVLNGLLRPPEDQKKPWLLFFGGNAMSLASSQFALQLADGDAGLGLATFAYRGYDGSTGRPTEEGILQDAEAIGAWLEREHGVAPERLVVVGQSLGSGVAMHLASALAKAGRPARALALLSPYTSMSQVANDVVRFFPIGWAISDRYDSLSRVEATPGPVLIVHGTHDSVISVRHGKRLAEAFGDRCSALFLEGREHNDLWDDRRTEQAIRTLALGP